MSQWYNHPKVFIRSLATRGSLGGLNPKIIEITDLLKAAGFDYIIVETVGIGQSEVEIAGLADITMVVLVPEAGDEIQTMKAGVMEIADIFVVNKSDRPGADLFVHHLTLLLSRGRGDLQVHIPVIKTIATEKSGTSELIKQIESINPGKINNERKCWLLSEQAYRLIQDKKMRKVNKRELQELIRAHLLVGKFNLYSFVEQYI
jgi:LAO/AO transport system kinase